MSGTDTYSNTTFTLGSWSDTVVATPPSGSFLGSVEIGGVGASLATLSGTVARPGDTVTLTLIVSGMPIQLQLQAAYDIVGGGVFTDSLGDTYVFANGQLAQGMTYDAVAGFGHFGDGPPQPACFAAGTRIETRRGAVPVEALRPGDEVRTMRPGRHEGGWAPVIWTGFRHVAVARQARSHAAWPVRIAADAFAPGVPRRDLLLSPDHAIHQQGVLIPIHLLLNDATIAQVPVERITYWHVELPRHDVLLAEGLEAESYLDTGNRGAFNGGTMPALDPQTASEIARRIWAERGCAPLRLDPVAHRALRRHLAVRATALGWQETEDAALELWLGGVRLGAGWDGQDASALLPAGATEVRLRSRSAVPSRAQDGSPDVRRLGVAVTRIRLDGHDVPVDDPRLRLGWHQPEGGWRWTDGEAVIPLTPGRPARRLEIQTAPMLTYWWQPQHCEAALEPA